jgi:hypothetical protein
VAAAEEARNDGATSFSKAFAKSLKANPDKCITIDRVSEKVINEVQKVQKQKPKFGNIQDMGDETGTFFFIKK